MSDKIKQENTTKVPPKDLWISYLAIMLKLNELTISNFKLLGEHSYLQHTPSKKIPLSSKCD